MDNYIRDRNGAVLGHVQQQGPFLYMYDRGGKVLGRYDPNTNATYDAGGMLVGYGNVLGSLLRS